MTPDKTEKPTKERKIPGLIGDTAEGHFFRSRTGQHHWK